MDEAIPKRLTAFISGRVVEAFVWGQSFQAIAWRFRISIRQAEAVVRRHERRARRKR